MGTRERGRKRGLGEDGQVVRGLEGCKSTQAFYSGRWEPWSAVGRGKAVPDSGAHTLPLVAGAGRADCGGEGESCRWCSQAPSGGFLGEDRMWGNGERLGGGVQGGGHFTGPSE